MIIIKSKILIKILSFNFARAMALFPFVIIKNESIKNNKIIINHEKIHLKQQIELLIIFFYLWYILEYFFHFIKFKNRRKAYEQISFEREAYANEQNLNYLNNRKLWNFISYQTFMRIKAKE